MKYHLQKYRKPSDKRTCPSCGKKQCFKVYVDENDTPLDEKTCGRCEHENSCGYHLPPKEWFKEHNHFPNAGKMAEGRAKEQIQYTMLTLPKEIVKQSLSRANKLCEFFETWVPFNPEAYLKACYEYCIGSTKSGQIIWWQIDDTFQVRTGKMMLYNSETGKRMKNEDGSSIGFNWVHSVMEKQGKFNRERDHTELRQCLFGQHLLNLPGNEDKPVAIVESEKSAFIASIEQPQYLWMATGGMYNLNAQALEPIIKQGRTIYLHPDRDGYERQNAKGEAKTNWIDKATSIIRETGYKNIQVHDFVLKNAQGPKDDIADIILYRHMVGGAALRKEEVALGLTEPNEALRELIKTFDTAWKK